MSDFITITAFDIVAGRLEDAIQRLPNREQDIRMLAELDPSGNNAYLAWAVKQLAANEDVSDIADAVERFHGRRDSLSKRDINAYPTVNAVDQALSELEKHKRERSLQKQRKTVTQAWQPEDVEGAELVGSTAQHYVYKINTHAGAEALGTTNWCIVRSESTFNDYTGGDDEHPTVDFYFHVRKDIGPPAAFAVAVHPESRTSETYDAKDDIQLAPVEGVHDWHEGIQDRAVEVMQYIRAAAAGNEHAISRVWELEKKSNERMLDALIERKLITRSLLFTLYMNTARSAPGDVLNYLVKRADVPEKAVVEIAQRIPQVILSQDVIPDVAVRTMAENQYWTIRRDLLRHSHVSIPADVLEALSNDSEAAVRYAAVVHQWDALSPSAQERLTADDSNTVRGAIAQRTKSDAALRQFITRRNDESHVDEDVAYYVASNEYAGPETLTEAFQVFSSGKYTYDGFRVLVRNPNTPDTVLIKILESQWMSDAPHEVFSALYQRTLLSRDVFEYMLNNPRSSVRHLVIDLLGHADLSDAARADALTQLSRDEDLRIVRAVALHKLTPTEVLNTLSTHDDKGVRVNVTHNKSTPVDVLQRLQQDPSWHVRDAAGYAIASVRAQRQGAAAGRYQVYVVDPHNVFTTSHETFDGLTLDDTVKLLRNLNVNMVVGGERELHVSNVRDDVRAFVRHDDGRPLHPKQLEVVMDRLRGTQRSAIRTCAVCAGDGVVECPECKGEGCDRCGDDGMVGCATCNTSGNVPGDADVIPLRRAAPGGSMPPGFDSFDADDLFGPRDDAPSSADPELQVGDKLRVDGKGPIWVVEKTHGAGGYVRREDAKRKWFGYSHDRDSHRILIYPVMQGSGDRTGPDVADGKPVLVGAAKQAAWPPKWTTEEERSVVNTTVWGELDREENQLMYNVDTDKSVADDAETYARQLFKTPLRRHEIFYRFSLSPPPSGDDPTMSWTERVKNNQRWRAETIAPWVNEVNETVEHAIQVWLRVNRNRLAKRLARTMRPGAPKPDEFEASLRTADRRTAQREQPTVTLELLCGQKPSGDETSEEWERASVNADQAEQLVQDVDGVLRQYEHTDGSDTYLDSYLDVPANRADAVLERLQAAGVEVHYADDRRIGRHLLDLDELSILISAAEPDARPATIGDVAEYTEEPDQLFLGSAEADRKFRAVRLRWVRPSFGDFSIAVSTGAPAAFLPGAGEIQFLDDKRGAWRARVAHELRHAADWAYGQAFDTSYQTQQGEERQKSYINLPTEVRSHAGDMAEELRARFGDDLPTGAGLMRAIDDADPTKAKAIRLLTPKNRRLFLEYLGAELTRRTAAHRAATPTVAVDLDGTLLERAPNGELGAPMKGAASAMTSLRDLGWRVLVYSERIGDDPQARSEIASHLAANGVHFDDIVVGPKPQADAYIDDRAIEFRGDWYEVLRRVTTYKGDRSSEDESDKTGVALIDAEPHPNDWSDEHLRRDQSIPR